MIKENFLKFKNDFLYVLLFSVFINLLMISPSIYMLQVYDRVMTSRSEDTLIFITLLLVYFFIIIGFLEYYRNGILSSVFVKFDLSLNKKIYNLIVNKSINNESQNIQPMNDLGTIRSFLTGNFFIGLVDLPWVFVYISILYLFHVYFAIFALAAILILLILSYIGYLNSKHELEESNKYMIESNNILNEQIRNSQVLSSMGMFERVFSIWENSHLKFLNNYFNSNLKNYFWTNLAKNIKLLSQSLILGVGAYLAINDEISAGMVIAGSILLGRALSPIDLISSSVKGYSAFKDAKNRLDDALCLDENNGEKLILPRITGDLRVKNLTVYQNDKKLLDSLNFGLLSGDVLCVLGLSGSGKTTLLKTLAGVVNYKEGVVEYDGADLKQYDSSFIGKDIGFLPQDVEIFDATIAQNIGRFEVNNDENVIEAAKLAGIHEFILSLPDGYNTKIGFSGLMLSGGQKQRIGIARAVYKKPKVVILDEPNSNLDEKGEQQLIRTINLLKENKTTVVIVTHKTNIISVCNKIIILSNGSVQIFGDKEFVIKEINKLKNGDKDVK